MQTSNTDQNATIRENQDATLHEEQNASATIREGQDVSAPGNTGASSIFQDYRIVEQLPAKGSEADIFIMEREGRR